MNARTIAGVQAQIAQPTDLFEFFHAARRDFSGTDYPGALELLAALLAKLQAQHATPREIRTFHARFIMALEGDTAEAGENARALVHDILGNYDLKA